MTILIAMRLFHSDQFATVHPHAQLARCLRLKTFFVHLHNHRSCQLPGIFQDRWDSPVVLEALHDLLGGGLTRKKWEAQRDAHRRQIRLWARRSYRFNATAQVTKYDPNEDDDDLLGILPPPHIDPSIPQRRGLYQGVVEEDEVVDPKEPGPFLPTPDNERFNQQPLEVQDDSDEDDSDEVLSNISNRDDQRQYEREEHAQSGPRRERNYVPGDNEEEPLELSEEEEEQDDEGEYA